MFSILWAECFCANNGVFHHGVVFDHYECFDDAGNSLGLDEQTCEETWTHYYLTCEMLDIEMYIAPHMCDHVEKGLFVRKCCTGNFLLFFICITFLM